jgi:hypothetical protein
MTMKPKLWVAGTGTRSSDSAQYPGQPADADRVAAVRPEDARPIVFRAHPAGYRPDAVSLDRYYAWLAYRLAEKTGQPTSCALPSGISVPHMFIVTFVIMLPIALKTGDPIKGGKPV